MTRSRARRPVVLALALLGLVAFGSTATAAVTAVDAADRTGLAGPVPILTAASATIRAPGAVTVTGEAFTPGGEVYVALYDQWGAALYETRWTTASRLFYGQNGSRDPAAGFSRGGALREAFGHPCGATMMVRAYDRQLAAWSNWLDVDLTAAGVAPYGPNGSADPAVRFRPGC